MQCIKDIKFANKEKNLFVTTGGNPEFKKKTYNFIIQKILKYYLKFMRGISINVKMHKHHSN